MALVVGTDSWVTLAEAETYFSGRVKTTAWDALTDQVKEDYLRTAFRWILYDPQYSAPKSADDDAVKNGQCEAALFLINYYDEFTKREALIASGVTSFTYSKWSEDLSEAQKPTIVRDMFASAGYFTGPCAGRVLEDDSVVI